MIPTGFAIVNQSALVSAEAAAKLCLAVALQWGRDIAPVWNLPQLTFRVCSFEEVQGSEICCLLTDQAPIPDDYGFHNDFGSPYIEIQAAVILGTKSDDASVLELLAPVLSHEVAEAGVDPLCNLTLPGPSSSLYALEVADPVQDNHYPVTLSDGTQVMVSDFVTPQWGDADATVPTKWDHMGVLSKAFEIKNGYQVEYDSSGNATEVWGNANRQIADLSSRRRRRLATKL